MIGPRRIIMALAFPLALSGCVTGDDYSRNEAGFISVANKTASVEAKETVWIQNRNQARSAGAQVKSLLARTKPGRLCRSWRQRG